MNRRDALKVIGLAAASLGVLGALPARKRFDFTRLAREPRTQEYTALVDRTGACLWRAGRVPPPPGFAVVGYITVVFPSGQPVQFEAVVS